MDIPPSQLVELPKSHSNNQLPCLFTLFKETPQKTRKKSHPLGEIRIRHHGCLKPSALSVARPAESAVMTQVEKLYKRLYVMSRAGTPVTAGMCGRAGGRRCGACPPGDEYRQRKRKEICCFTPSEIQMKPASYRINHVTHPKLTLSVSRQFEYLFFLSVCCKTVLLQG